MSVPRLPLHAFSLSLPPEHSYPDYGFRSLLCNKNWLMSVCCIVQLDGVRVIWMPAESVTRQPHANLFSFFSTLEWKNPNLSMAGLNWDGEYRTKLATFSDYKVENGAAEGHIPRMLVKSSFWYPLICRDSPILILIQTTRLRFSSAGSQKLNQWVLWRPCLHVA